MLNPGSDEAVEAGCSCPIVDNNHGISAPLPDDCWVVNLDCPIHGQGVLDFITWLEGI